jgi:hypothetical protein
VLAYAKNQIIAADFGRPASGMPFGSCAGGAGPGDILRITSISLAKTIARPSEVTNTSRYRRAAEAAATHSDSWRTSILGRRYPISTGMRLTWAASVCEGIAGLNGAAS